MSSIQNDPNVGGVWKTITDSAQNIYKAIKQAISNMFADGKEKAQPEIESSINKKQAVPSDKPISDFKQDKQVESTFPINTVYMSHIEKEALTVLEKILPNNLHKLNEKDIEILKKNDGAALQLLVDENPANEVILELSVKKYLNEDKLTSGSYSDDNNNNHTHPIQHFVIDSFITFCQQKEIISEKNYK